MMVYLAAAEPLPLVAWNEADPTFHVSDLAPEERRVGGHFGPHVSVVFAGAHEGCRCGFQYGEYPAEHTEPEEVLRRRRSLDAFATYLREQLRRVDAMSVYACWDGDQEAPPAHRRTLVPTALERDDFHFMQRELSTFVADPPA